MSNIKKQFIVNSLIYKPTYLTLEAQLVSNPEFDKLIHSLAISICANPHITILYNFKPWVTAEHIKEYLPDISNKKVINIENYQIFYAKDNFHFVGLVNCDWIYSLNKNLSTLAGPQTYENYNPHSTLNISKNTYKIKLSELPSISLIVTGFVFRDSFGISHRFLSSPSFS